LTARGQIYYLFVTTAWSWTTITSGRSLLVCSINESLPSHRIWRIFPRNSIIFGPFLYRLINWLVVILRIE
jgi:hypothetical protein